MSERSRAIAQSCSGLLSEFTSRLDDSLSLLPSPGLNAAIMVDDEVIWKHSVGLAHYNPDVPLTPDHLHRIGSITKLFTATAILLLCEEGKLALDELITEYLPGYKPRYPVSLRHVLCHGGAIPTEGGMDVWNTGIFPDTDEYRRLIGTASFQPVEPPMLHLKYSNAAYSMLGLVIESVSKMSYEGFITERILERLNLRETFFHLTPEMEKRFAYGHIIPAFQRRFEQAPHQELKAFSAAGMLLSTTSDLLRFAASHWSSSRLVSQDTANQMFRMHNLDKTWTTGWGLGWNLKRHNGRTFLGHGGGYLGNRCRLDMSLENRMAVSIYANCASAMGNYEIPAEFLGRMLDALEKKGSVLKADPPTPEALALLGNYRSGYWSSIQIQYGPDGLRIRPGESQWGDLLEPVTPARYRLTEGRQVGEELTVMEHGTDGRVSKIVMAGHVLYRI